MIGLQKHDYSIDLLRIFGTIGVMVIHLWYPVFSRPDFLGGKSWWLANIGHSLSLISVPLFIMISGYLILEKEESLRETFHRVLVRLAIPLAFWFTAYVFWNNIFLSKHLTPMQIISMVASGGMYHLYYLPLLMGLYLSVPWIQSLMHTANAGLAKYSFIFAWILGIGIYAMYYLKLVNNASMSIFTWWIPFLGYFITGHLIRHADIKVSLEKMAALFSVWSIFTIIMSYEGVQMVEWDLDALWQNGIFYFNTFLSPNVIIMSIAAFVIIIKIFKQSAISKYAPLLRIMSWLSTASFAVYLVHFAIINWIDMRLNYAIEFVSNNLFGFMIVRTLLVFFISYLVASVIRKTPLLKKVVGE